MRTHFRALVFILVVLIAAGPLIYFGKTGKLDLGFGKAKATAETYTISGYATDPITDDPQEGRTITISSYGVDDVQVQTNSSGYYSGSIEVEPGAQIGVQEDLSMGLAGEGYTIIAEAGGGTFPNKNFKNNPVPFSYDDLDEFLGPNPSQRVLDIFDKKVIDLGGGNNVIFTTLKNPTYFVDIQNSYQQQLATIAQQIGALRSATQINNLTPQTIIIAKTLSWWNNNPSGVTEVRAIPSENKTDMFLKESVVNTGGNPILRTVVHEWGHIVSWAKGHTLSPNSRYAAYCRVANWCAAVDNRAFAEAYQTTSNFLISGYATTNMDEMFAEFTAWMMPRLDAYNPEENTDLTQRPSYILAYWLWNNKNSTGNRSLTPNSDLHWGGVGSQYITDINHHNSLIYLTEFVRNYTNLPLIFPRVIVDDSNFESGTVFYGSWMGDQAVVTLKLMDHLDAVIDTAVTLGGSNGQTNNPHLGGFVFNSVTAGDLLFNLTPATDYPVPFAGETLNLVSGSNYKEVRYRQFLTQYIVHPYDYPAGTFNLQIINNPPPVFSADYKTENGVEVSGTKIGTIPRYPNLGTQNGGGTVDPTMPNNPTSLYYKINYIIGGGDEVILPMQATLKGPFGYGWIGTPFIPPTVTEQYISTGGANNIVEGILNKRCYHEDTAWPWCNLDLPWPIE